MRPPSLVGYRVEVMVVTATRWLLAAS